MSSVKFKERRFEILEAVRKGIGISRAAELHGVSRQAVYEWIKRGDRDIEAGDEDTPHALFATQIREEIAKTDSLMERSVLKAGVSDWHAAAWWLERKHPQEYGNKGKLEVEVKNQLTVEFLDYLRDRVDADTYNRVLAALTPEGSEPPPAGQLSN